MSGGVYSVIVSELSYGQLIIPVNLPLVHKQLKELLYFLVDSFSLTICLRVEVTTQPKVDSGNV